MIMEVGRGVGTHTILSATVCKKSEYHFANMLCDSLDTSDYKSNVAVFSAKEEL